MPERIRVRRVKGWTMPKDAKYVGRPTQYGNPFKVSEEVDRDSALWPYIAETVPGGVFGLDSVTPLARDVVVDAYGAWLLDQPALMLTAWDDLAGRDLACWCPLPAPGERDYCHARFLLEMVNDD